MVDTCNTCGNDHDTFREGHCIDCWTDRQNALDLHNAEYDRWSKLTNQQRDFEIRRAGNG